MTCCLRHRPGRVVGRPARGSVSLLVGSAALSPLARGARCRSCFSLLPSPSTLCASRSMTILRLDPCSWFSRGSGVEEEDTFAHDLFFTGGVAEADVQLEAYNVDAREGPPGGSGVASVGVAHVEVDDGQYL